MADISSNLLYYYKFDKEDIKGVTLKNHATGNYDATLSSSLAISNRNYYIGNSCLDSERGSFYVPVTIPTTGFSISFWICGTTTAFSTQLGHIMGWYFYNYRDRISFYHETERAFAYNVMNNIWYHIIITISTTTTNNFVSYRNGELHISRSLGNNYPPSSTYISLHSKYLFYDDFRVYNYVITSRSDIEYLLNYPSYKKYTNSLSSTSLLSKLSSNFYDIANQNLIFDNEPRNMLPGTIVLLSGKPTSKTSNLGNYSNSVTYSSISQAIFNSQYSALYVIDSSAGSISIINTQTGFINVLPTIEAASKIVENRYNLNRGIKSLAFDISQNYYYVTNGSYVQQMNYITNNYIQNINTVGLTNINYCITDSNNFLYIAHSSGIGKINLSESLPTTITEVITTTVPIIQMTIVNNILYAIDNSNLEIYVINPKFNQNQIVTRAIPSTINANTYSYTSSDIYNGLYSIASSSTNGTNFPYKAFDNNTTTEYVTASNYNATGYTSTQKIVDVLGEWMTIQLPYALNLTSYTILSSSNDSNCVKDWLIYKYDGVAWSVIDTRTEQKPNTVTTYTLATPVQAFRFGILIMKTNNTTTTLSGASLIELNLIGTYMYHKLQFFNVATAGSKLSSICGDTIGNLYVSTTSVTRCIFFIPIVFLTNLNTILVGIGSNRADILAYTQNTSSIGYAGDGGACSSATFNNISHIMMDAGNNMYICDTSNCTIRKIINKAITTNYLNTITDEMGISSQYDISTLYSPSYSIGTNENSNYCIGTTSTSIDSNIHGSTYNVIDSSGLILYYRFNSQDVKGLNLANYSTGFPVYDASLSVTNLVNSTDFALDNAALNIPTTGFVTINNSKLTTGINSTSVFNTNGLSFTCWVKSNNTGTNGRIFEIGNSVSASNSIVMCISGNIINPAINKNSIVTNYNTNYSINNNIWHHICWTLTYSTGSTSNHKVYVDGDVIYNITTGTYPNNAVTYPLCYVGKSTYNSDPLFNGIIDDFRFYNRILSQSEVSTLYNKGTYDISFVDLITIGAIPTLTVTNTEYSYSIINDSVPIRNGTYNIVASSTGGTTVRGMYAFDNNNSTFHESAGTHYTNGIWNNTTTESTTFSDSTVINRDYSQIQLPYMLKMISYKVVNTSSFATISIKSYILAGSTDGTIWDYIDYVDMSSNPVLSFDVSLNTYGNSWTWTYRNMGKKYYNYFRFIGNSMSSGFKYQLAELQLYGIGKYIQNVPTTNTFSLTQYDTIPVLTANTTTISNYTPTILNGNYIASQSSALTTPGSLGYLAFDYNVDNSWVSNTVYNSTGAYTGTRTTTFKNTTSAITISGEWLQIQLPYSLSITGYTLLPRSSTQLSQFPKQWYLVGSNDGSNWYAIDYKNAITPTYAYLSYGNGYVNKNYYSYFRLIFMASNNTLNTNSIAINQMQLVGTGKPLEQYTNTYELPTYNAVPTMTSASTTISGNMPAILNGTYICSSSANGFSNNYYEYYAFDSNTSTFWNGGYFYNSLGTYIGTNTTTIVNIGSILGEWIQIQLPYSLSLSGYRILPRSGGATQFPKNWYMVGSNNGTTWYAIDNETNISVAANTNIYYNYNISYGNNNYYLYFRLIIMSISGTGTNSGTTIADIKLQGTGTDI